MLRRPTSGTFRTLATVLTLVLTLAVGAGAGCQQSAAPAPAQNASGTGQAAGAGGSASSKAEPATSKGAQPEPPAETATPDYDARVKALVTEMGTKPRCNDLNGCAMVNSLRLLGKEAAPAIARLYGGSKGDAFWRLRLLEAIGHLKAPESADFLLQVARTDPKAPARAEALMALGRLGQRDQAAVIAQLAASLDPVQDLPVLLAAGYAMAKLGNDDGRELIARHLVVPEKTLRWDRLRPGVFAAGALRMTELREPVEQLVGRADPFVRREAVRALIGIRDRRSIPVLIKALEDPVPGVRDEAQRALVTLTGHRHRVGVEQWTRWLEKNPVGESQR